MRIALTGDTLLTRPLAPYREPEFLALRELISGADAGYTNLESSVGRYLELPHAPKLHGLGSYMTTEPELLEDLAWMGISVCSSGSSHADDYGPAGVLRTLQHLDASRLAHAGSGRHLLEARAPAYLETAAGRVALVAATLQFNAAGRAGDQRRDAPGWPGVNGIRNELRYLLPPGEFTEVRALAERLALDRNVPGGNDTFELLGRTVHADASAPAPAVRPVGDESDIAETLRQVEIAREFADLVMFSLHCHATGGGARLAPEERMRVGEPSELSKELLRRAVDRGADIAFGHGPQVPMGIELVAGKPVLHGLGTFIFQIETIRHLPQEAYDRYGLGLDATPLDFLDARYGNGTRGHLAHADQWHQAVALVDFDGRELRRVQLHPIDLGFERPRSQPGRPMLAGGTVAEEVLERIGRCSAALGTAVAVKDGVGVVEG